MKTLIGIIACFISFSVTLFAQSANPAHNVDGYYNTLRTNPDNPLNTEIPQKQNGGSIYHSNPIFDWRSYYFKKKGLCDNEQIVISPYEQTDNDLLTDICTNKDYKPESGWELITQRFGDPMDSEDFLSGINFPYFILYNRYTGLLRFFISVCETEAYQSARFTLQFNSGRITSALDLGVSSEDKPFRALDDSIGLPKYTSVCEFKNESKKWFYADFTMMYDPCGCLINTSLDFKVDLIREGQIALTATTKGIIDPAYLSNGTIDPDLFTVRNKAITSNKINNSKSYGAMDLINNVGSIGKKATDTYNSLTYMNSWYQGFVNSFSSLPSDSPSNLNTKADTKDDAVKGFSQLAKEAEKPNFLSMGLKAIPYIGSTLSILDAFFGGGQANSGPLKVSMTPTGIMMSTAIKGTITEFMPHKGFVINTPGSQYNGLDDFYPYYNRTLGVFNLLRTPVLKQEKIQIHEDRIEPIEPQTNNPYYTVNLKTKFAYKVKLDNDIQYVINPAAGLKMNTEDIEIYAELLIQRPGMDLYFVPDNNTIPYTTPKSFVRMTSEIYRSHLMPLECLKDLPLGIYYEYENGGITLNPDDIVVPYNQFINSNISPSTETKAFLKLVVNLKRADGNGQNVLWVGTYPLKVENVGFDESNTWDWNNPWHSINNTKVEFIDTEILETTKTTEQIIVEGSTRAQSTNNIELVSYTDIQVKPSENNESVLRNETVLRIGPPVECYQPRIAPATFSQVQSLCNSSIYKSNHNYNAKREGDNNKPANESKQSSISISPNPLNDLGLIELELPDGSPVTINIMDNFGNVVAVVADNIVMQEGDRGISFSTKDIPSGLYYVSVRTKYSVLSEKLIVIH